MSTTWWEAAIARGNTAIAAATDVVDEAQCALRWAAAEFGDSLVIASSMGDEVLVDLASAIVPGADLLFIDTGYHFAQTIATRDGAASRYHLNVRSIEPLLTIAEQAEIHGPDLFARDPDRCCDIRKVEPLERGLAPYAAWVTGMRREDAPTRQDLDVVTWDAKRGKVKLNPLARWTADDVTAYVIAHDVLLNPLRDLGYPSIGCQPCTRPVAVGEDPRSGRWSGFGKTECGLHT